MAVSVTLPTYVLDANVFIEAHRRYYAFDLCPGFWESLLWHQGRGRIRSLDRVKSELERGKDELATWVRSSVPRGCFLSSDDEDITAISSAIFSWVQDEEQYLPQAKAEFAEQADGWLLALAKARQFVLVTHEVLAPEARRTVPLPNVCRAFNVPWVDTFSMLRELETRFHWQVPG